MDQQNLFKDAISFAKRGLRTLVFAYKEVDE